MFAPGIASYPSLSDAYLSGLRDILSFGRHVESVKDPNSVASNWGCAARPSRELIGYSFRVNDPTQSLFYSSARVVRLDYLFGLFLWTIAGSNDATWLGYYHPLALNFSDDGMYLCGAFGKRLLNFRDSINQLEAISNLLRKDAASRRTFAAICTPEDNVLTTREYPCCIGVQYFLREGALHAITHMRAQSAFGVLPYDAFLFMTLQQLLAARLSLRNGAYIHQAGTFHLYESELEDVRKVLDSPITPIEVGELIAAESVIEDVLNFECTLREATIHDDSSYALSLLTDYYNSTSFWDQTKIVLLLHSLQRLKRDDEIPSLIERLPANFRPLANQNFVSQEIA